MKIANVESGDRALIVTWDDETQNQFPYIWLRDNALDEFHPDTKERVFDLTTVDVGIEPADYDVRDSDLTIKWPGKDPSSVYPADWLREHRPGLERPDPARIEPILWDCASLPDVPRIAVEQCIRPGPGLFELLHHAKRYGIVVVEGLADDPEASHTIGRRIGFRRETNFGEMFDVISKPSPNNLAYTALALPLHTDLPNQEAIPGFQFLHSYKNAATGGDSVFADGFRICSDLAEESPENFEFLSSVALPWRFHDQNNDIRYRRPIINLSVDGSLESFAFNAHIADLPDMEVDVLYRFYPAYQDLMRRIRDRRYAISFRLEPGDMAIFDNRRVLHGRDAFDPASGERHFRGFYMEHNEINNRIRVLARNERQILNEG